MVTIHKNVYRKVMKKLVVMLSISGLVLTLTACGSPSKASNVSAGTSVSGLTQTACKNLPNLLNWLNWGDINKPWSVSLNAFGALARQDPKYLPVSIAAAKIADTVGPFYDGTKDSESVDPQVQIVNGFCAGLGTLTPQIGK